MKRATYIFPFVAFFLSGASSLVFQTIWSRLLHHVFGSSSVAISSVVSAFMGGLALGAWFFGRHADRVRNPLKLYAFAEIGVGLTGLAVPWLLRTDGPLADINAVLRQSMDVGSLGFLWLRFLCIVPVLIVPTALMGATLPLLVRHFVGRDDSPERASERIGMLYAVNTLGALVGVFLAGFVLMPRIGVETTNTVAACGNFVLAALILVMLRSGAVSAPGNRDSETDADPDPQPVASTGARTGPSRPARLVAAWAFALSGLASLLYEVVWSRALINTIGGSVYSFALILMTFLVGIAGGSAATSAIHRGASALPGALLASTVLVPLAFVPTAVTQGALAFSLGCAVAWSVLWMIAARIRRAQHERRTWTGVDESHDPVSDGMAGALLACAVPAACAAVGLLWSSGRLGMMCGSVVALDALLLALLVGLRERPGLLLAALQAFIAGASLISDMWADSLSLAFASVVTPFYDVLAQSIDIVMGLMLLMALLCMLPAALAMGAMFPVTMRVWTAGGRRVGRDVGIVYTGNTVGSIAGAWLPGFLLMPLFGMQGTLHIGIALNLALALMLFAFTAERPVGSTGSSRRRIALAVPAWAACAALLHGATVRPDSWLSWDMSRMTLGAFRISLARDVLDEEAWGAPELVYYRDGLSTTVTVERWGRHFSLKNNGKVDASNGDDMPTQIVVAGFPLLMHSHGSEDLDVAIIGFGSGVTVGAALQFPVRSVDVIELEDAVLEASRFFADVNHIRYTEERFPYTRMPRLRVYGDDGRNFLAATDRRYDVIVSEPSNPWLTGVSSLFTTDHFRVSKRRLKQDGIYCQWVQLYELSPENVKIIYRTFAEQFEHVVVFSAEDLSSDTVLIGSDTPLDLDLARVRAGFARPRVAAELERAYLHSPQDVFARVLLASREEMLSYAQVERRLVDGRWELQPGALGAEPCEASTCSRTPSPLNTDDNALIEFSAPRDLIGFERYKGYLESFYTDAWPYGKLAGRITGFDAGAAGSRDLAQQAVSLMAHGRGEQAGHFAAMALQRADTREARLADALLQALSPGHRGPEPPAEVPAAAERLSAPMRERVADAYAELRRFRERREPWQAFMAIDRIPVPVRASLGPATVLLHADLARRAHHEEVTLDALEALVRERPAFAFNHPELHYVLARAHDTLQHFDKAVRNMRVYVEAQLTALPDESSVPAEAPGTVTDLPGFSDKRFSRGEEPPEVPAGPLRALRGGSL